MLTAILLVVETATAAPPLEVVEQYVDAFNERNVEAMIDLTAADVRWMSVSGDQITVETSNRIALRAAMSTYFNSPTAARSELRSVTQSGPFVHTVEEAFWTAGDVEKSQCSMAMYELVEGKIQNVWYFAAFECP